MPQKYAWCCHQYIHADKTYLAERSGSTKQINQLVHQNKPPLLRFTFVYLMMGGEQLKYGSEYNMQQLNIEYDNKLYQHNKDKPVHVCTAWKKDENSTLSPRL